MENKFWKGVLTGALLTAFAGLIIVGLSAGIYLCGKNIINNQQVQVQNQTQSEKHEGGGNSQMAETLDMDSISDKLNTLQKYVNQYYLFDEDMESMEEGIYTGFMYGLGDPYSVYYTAEDYAKMMEDTEGVYCGIGVQVSQNRTTGLVTVSKVFKGTPGLEAGVLPGDIIYAVDGTEVAGMELDIIVSNYIKGEEGTPVTITMYRADKDEYVELTMNRRMIEVPTVEFEMLDNKVGYIMVSQFDKVTSPQFIKAVDSLESQGMEKLIVDLRNNPGGLLDSVVEMLAYILPDGKIVYTADKNGKGSMFKSENGYVVETGYPETENQPSKKYFEDNHFLDLPIAVLVNENSASASEVFTGAIRDYDWGTIVGTTTFGKGIVQSLIPMKDGTAIKLTVSHYFTPDGSDIHGKGIKPDVEIELNEELKNMVEIPKDQDNQLQKALEILE